MEGKRQEIIEIINKAIDEINDLKKNIKKRNESGNEISKVIKELEVIKSGIKTTEPYYNNKILQCEKFCHELSQKKAEMELSEIQGFFKVIEKNLIDGMYLENENGDGIVKLIYHKNEKENEYVGKIVVLGAERPDIKIFVEVGNSKETFTMHEPLKVYNIISFININFNYSKEI